MVFGDEHVDVRGAAAGKRACRPRRQRLVDVEEPGDRLLLEPLARIARRDAGIGAPVQEASRDSPDCSAAYRPSSFPR